MITSTQHIDRILGFWSSHFSFHLTIDNFSTRMSGATHQILILDANPHAWNVQQQDSKNLISFKEYIDIIYAFSQAHLMMNKGNTVQIVAVHPTGCTIIFPDTQHLASLSFGDNDLSLNMLVERLLPLTAISSPPNASLLCISHLAQALSISLCGVNRMLRERPSSRSKILCLQAYYIFFTSFIRLSCHHSLFAGVIRCPH